jgi:hypothetical protein
MASLRVDRNGNGRVDDGSELFGNYTPLSDGRTAGNGFEALREFDDNGDGKIDARDTVWQRLLLWTDRNHDGVSQPDELTPIANSSVVSISVAYMWTGRRDRWGNTYRYESRVIVRAGDGSLLARPVYDIYFSRANL